MSENSTAAMQKELLEYKRKITTCLLNSKELVEGLAASVDDSELLYNNVYPYGTIPEMQEEAKCILTVEVTMPNVSTENYFFKDVLVVITIICHHDLMRANELGIPRHDYLSARIAELLDGNTSFGYGEMQLVSNTESAFTERHAGRVMRFKTQEMAKTNLCV